MKYIIFLLLCGFILFGCQKDADRDPPTSHFAIDTLAGEWKYQYDYRLVATTTNPTVIIDSVFSGNYAPLSYLKINSDSTFKWWRTAMQTEPAVGYGVAGRIIIIDQGQRFIRWREEIQTNNNFSTQTTLSPPRQSPQYNIKILTQNKAVLSFTVLGPDGNLWHWHDVYTR